MTEALKLDRNNLYLQFDNHGSINDIVYVSESIFMIRNPQNASQMHDCGV